MSLLGARSVCPLTTGLGEDVGIKEPSFTAGENAS
jgi:hypothetical protein